MNAFKGDSVIHCHECIWNEVNGEEHGEEIADAELRKFGSRCQRNGKQLNFLVQDRSDD